MLDILRVLNIGAWLIVMVYMAPAVWSLLCSRTRSGDPGRLLFFCFGIVQVAGTARWFIAPGNETSWAAIYILCIALGLYTLKIARSYGRGDRV